VGDGSPHSKWKNINKADNLPVNEAYKKAIDSESDYLNGAIETALPAELSRCFPNPFNPTVTIQMQLPFAGNWNITILNILGHKVEEFNGYADAGLVSIAWNASYHPESISIKLPRGNQLRQKRWRY
jgi:hypothetical protein